MRPLGHTLKTGWEFQKTLWESKLLAAIDYSFYLLDYLVWKAWGK